MGVRARGGGLPGRADGRGRIELFGGGKVREGERCDDAQRNYEEIFRLHNI